MSTKLTCRICFKPKANLHCALCNDDICKYCAQFLTEDDFAYLKDKPAELTHNTYCPKCFDDKVAASLTEYNEYKAKAEEVLLFYKKEGKATRLLKRKEPPYVVENCRDRDDALGMMSFWAVKDNFNALLDIELASKKTMVDTYVTITWYGSAVPIFMTAEDESRTGYKAP